LAPRAGLPEQSNINALDRLTGARALIDAKGLFGTVANLVPKPPLTKRGPGCEETATGAKTSKRSGRCEPTERTPRPQTAASLARLIAAAAVVTVYDGQRLVGVVTKHASTHEAHETHRGAS
jgi:hypothetical protein